MRLLQAMAGARHGGAEAFFVRLAGALEHRDGLDQRVLLRRGGAWNEALIGQGVELRELPFGGLLDFRSKNLFEQNIADFMPDVVLTWMNRATRFCPAPSVDRPYVHAARLGGYYNLKYYRRCDHLIGNTRHIVDYITGQGWPAERAHYLPNFVDAETQPAVDRKAFETPEAPPLLLALGRLHTNKAFDVLIAALAQIPGAYLWIAGEGPERAALTSLAKRLGVDDRLRLLGWRDDTAALLAAADVLVCPSRHEPLGNVVIEAWAHGIPVAACDAAGPKGLINDGANGLLSPLDDASALAANVNRQLDDADLRRWLAEGGRTTYEAEFTEDVVASAYLDFFYRIAKSC